MMKYSKLERYAIIKTLWDIMNADSIIHPNEEEFINRIYNEYEISIDEIGDISNIDILQARIIINGMAEYKKEKARFLCLCMAGADGYIHPKEVDVINEIFD